MSTHNICFPREIKKNASFRVGEVDFDRVFVRRQVIKFENSTTRTKHTNKSTQRTYDGKKKKKKKKKKKPLRGTKSNLLVQ